MTTPSTPAPRKRTPAKATDHPAVEEATPTAVKRRSLLALPDGWQYEVVLVHGEDSIRVLPDNNGEYQVDARLNGRVAQAAAPDLSSGLDTARQILKQYVAYREQMLAFEDSISNLGGVVGVAHVDADSATTGAQAPVHESSAAPTVAEREVDASTEPTLV